jgi:hypothetical protein
METNIPLAGSRREANINIFTDPIPVLEFRPENGSTSFQPENSLIYSTLSNEPEEVNRIISEHNVDMDDLTSSLEIALRRKYKDIENILKTELVARDEIELQNALKDAESDDDNDMMEIISECIDEKERLMERRKRARERIEEIQPKKRQKIETGEPQISVLGEESIKDKEIITLISNERIEKYLKSELQQIVEKSDRVYIWSGPPAGCVSFHIGICPHAMLERRVIKLPWSGIWILEKDLKLIIEIGSEAIVQSRRCSVGSYFGMSTLHGQWGGFWRRGEGDMAIFVEDGNSLPDDRELLYDVISVEKRGDISIPNTSLLEK